MCRRRPWPRVPEAVVPARTLLSRRADQADLDDRQPAPLKESADHHWRGAGAPSDGQSLGGYTVSGSISNAPGQPLMDRASVAGRPARTAVPQFAVAGSMR
jgi:hypothetical protein